MKKILSLLAMVFVAASGSAHGQLLLTEFSANPASLSDDFGEYLEVFNTGTIPISVDGLTLSDNDSDSFTFSGTGLTIAPGSFFVFGDPENTDLPSYVDATWGEGSFLLTNTADEIIISNTSGTLISLFYPDGDPFGPGTAAVLNSTANDDSIFSNFIAETTTIGANTGGTNPDLGSPGSAGSTVVSSIPEPSCIALLGLAGLTGVIRRRK